jgi:hypothetical protein
MKSRTSMTVTLAVVGAGIAAVLITHHRPAEMPAPKTLATPSPPALRPAPNSSDLVLSAPPPPVEVDTSAAPAATPAPVEAHAPAAPAPKPAKIPARNNAPNQTPGNPGRQKPPIQDPDARAALSFVGVDPEAEGYWASAINDANLPAEERKDLIEDLNEDGLSDPHHPGPEDMPVIASRIALIEELASYAMDKVNADAFAEAYKDLVGLLNGQEPQ